MAGIVVLLVVITISLIATRVAAVALSMTGVSTDLARFQARSAFSGVGFTTEEAERMMRHPVRRRIVMALMLAGNAGLVTAVASIVFAVVRTDDASSGTVRGVVLVGGLVALYLASRSQAVERGMHHLIDRALHRWTDLDLHDYESLLDLTGDYTVVEVEIGPSDWLAEHPLADLDLPGEGILVLAVHRRDGQFLGAPGEEVVLEPGDTLVVYGHCDAIGDLSGRIGGETGAREHEQSVNRHRAELSRNARSDEGPRRSHHDGER